MIEKALQLSTAPSRVYSTLTDSTAFSEMTGGAPASINDEAGSSFSLFGGMIEGRNVECEASVRLVQAWRPKTWDAGHYSLVRFELTEHDGGTQLLLTHDGFPQEQEEHLSNGWEANYLQPLKKLFG